MQSWKQRLRWSKGFYQINGKYLGSLVTSAGSGKKNRMSCYDVLMTVAPCMLLTIFIFGFNILMLGWGFTMPYYLQILFQREATKYLVYAIINSYLGMIVIGGLTVATEWKRIKATTVEKIKYIWMFPFFMVSYIPITLQALFSKVEWSPIKHYSSKTLQKKDNHAYSSEN
jgi:cellulose synthase/poly-beta-1,6-N-acetylglucosamine synthase-like glycosyltransferase